MSSDIIAANGDLWVVRPCEEEGCTVVEHWITRQAPVGFDALVAKYSNIAMGKPPPHPEGVQPEDADHDVHIPADVLPQLIAALQAEAKNTIPGDDE